MIQQTIDEKQYSNFSLEELREQQEKFFLRNSNTKKPMPPQELAYWEIVFNAPQRNPFEEVLVDLERQDDVKPDIKPWMDYQEAKASLWFFMKRIAQRKKFTWVIYPDLKILCELVAAYFSGNAAEGLDLHKGFFIYGPCGGGKSELILAAQMMARALNIEGRKFGIAEAERIVQETNRVDDAHLGRYYRENWAFDDMGNSNMTFKQEYTGNVINPMQTIFTKRSRVMQVRYIATHITSNVAPEDYTGVFDARVLSRWSQMFNFFLLQNPEDYRPR